MKNCAEFGAVVYIWEVQSVPVECLPIAEADDKDSFAVLGNKRLGVDDARGHRISKLIPESPQNDLKSSSPIMTPQILNVLQQEGSRAFGSNNPRDIKKQCSLSFIKKAVQPTQTVLLANSR